jgi:hypothetical protein
MGVCLARPGIVVVVIVVVVPVVAVEQPSIVSQLGWLPLLPPASSLTSGQQETPKNNPSRAHISTTERRRLYQPTTPQHQDRHQHHGPIAGPTSQACALVTNIAVSRQRHVDVPPLGPRESLSSMR